MALKDVIGQDRAINILKGCISKERIPHALLFAGDEGVGKRLTAVNFAKALNCTHNSQDDLFAFGAPEEEDTSMQADEDACDKCPSCSKIDKENHPDALMIGPEGESKQITVSSIRKLEESLSYKPFEGDWKIAIIDNADRLNQSAANAFLQTLEEPSAQSILILVSSRPEMLLPTIRSRCQRINFSSLPLDRMTSLLKEKFGYGEERNPQLLSLLAGGRLGYALEDTLIEQRDSSFNIFMQMLQSSDEEVWQDKESMEEWFEWSQLLIRDVAVYKATSQKELLINQDMFKAVVALASSSQLPDILKLARDLYNIKRKLTFNLNKQLTFNYISLLLRRNMGQRQTH